MSDLHWDRLALRFLGIVVVAFDFNDVVVVFFFDFSGAWDGPRRFGFAWFEEFAGHIGGFAACTAT